jgi:hypothetical protein
MSTMISMKSMDKCDDARGCRIGNNTDHIVRQSDLWTPEAIDRRALGLNKAKVYVGDAHAIAAGAKAGR